MVEHSVCSRTFGALNLLSLMVTTGSVGVLYVDNTLQ